MELLEGILSRRSVRQFTDEPVSPAEVEDILRAGAWAPSGLNNQPWRFAVVRDREKLRSLAGLTRYRHIVEGAPVSIAVFCDREAMYHETKDHQAIGACLQNMLLAAHALGLGAVWLGEILKSAGQVRDLLGLPPNLELMAVIAVGRPAGVPHHSDRKPLSELIVAEF
ncbi:nitroreductase [Geobacter sulfurreducens]|uniref:nitroreductase n=1 Tax=Geobacter sulfurreducens TaxID=35554 RepID=UPI000DBB0CE3|nr:nitroreductase [Geobacter sulfurreducens]BBA70954.1 NADPH-flavin oxidoreductase [Geobacter sulfurreducens]